LIFGEYLGFSKIFKDFLGTLPKFCGFFGLLNEFQDFFGTSVFLTFLIVSAQATEECLGFLRFWRIFEDF
jgi:hypothetical protein